MPTYGPFPATSAVNRGDGGFSPWSNPTNIFTSNDTYSTGAGILIHPGSQTLVATGFGFSIPGGEYVVGMECAVEANYGLTSSSPPSCGLRPQIDSAGSPINAGTIQYYAGWLVSPTDTTFVYGSSSSTFGVALTPSIVNNANFGVGLFAVYQGGGGASIWDVDYLTITIYTSLTPPATGYKNMLLLGVG